LSTTSLAHPARPSTPDLKIEVPVEEELLAACEAALEWFEDRARNQDPDHAFGGEGRAEQKLRRALAEVWIRRAEQKLRRALAEVWIREVL
jgi:hypothetical protein